MITLKDIILDTLLDVFKLVPFLFFTFLLMELLEHKMKNKSKQIIKKSGKLSPLIGSFLGAFPQCGFSVAATNLYATRVISIGTLIAIYLSTSDEMLPVLLSKRVPFSLVVSLILIKIIVGATFGFLIDFIYRKTKNNIYTISDFCIENHCHCNHGIVKSAFHHTVNIILFIAFLSFLLNIGFEYLGHDIISKILMKDSLLGPFLSSLIGLVPNCGSSVIITNLYLNQTISFGSFIAGLLTGSGVAIMVLFKVNKSMKDNVQILFILYFIGATIGLVIDLLSIVI